MKQKLVPVAPLFRSDGQAAVIATLRFAHDGISLSDLADRTGLAVSAVHTEIERLEAAGITRSERVGRTRLVSLDPASPVASEVAGLADKLLGVEHLLADAILPIDGVECVLIFGSWAAQRRGGASEGGPPADIDLLVVGDADADTVFRAVRPVEEIIARPINPVLRTAIEWHDDESGFASSVRSGPTIELVADG